MTKEEARSVLEKSKEVASWVDSDGVTCHHQLGEFYGELPDSYGFIVYPYSSKDPIDPLYAFVYWVDRDSGEIVLSSAPLSPDELKQLEGI